MDFSPRVQELKVEAAKCCYPTVPSATADNDAMGRLPQKKKKQCYLRQAAWFRPSVPGSLVDLWFLLQKFGAQPFAL